MKLMYVRLENYIGIYNGIGQNVLEIDFSKSKNPIIAIKGNNGSGKSTLLKALTPFPDESHNFIPGLVAKKYISYSLDGNIYDISYIHELTKDNKVVTKARIAKNGEELNPNQNINSCKELIFSIFELDSNFISLSQLSSEDRGLADNLNVYNNMYKILVKKSSYLKNTINSISTKIKAIGNKEDLLGRLQSLDKQITQLSKEKDNAIASLGSLAEKKKQLDPDGSIEAKINNLSRECNLLKFDIDGWEQEYSHLIRGASALSQLNSLNKEIVSKNEEIVYLTSRQKSFEEAMQKQIDILAEKSKELSLVNSELEGIDFVDVSDLTEKYFEEKKELLDTLDAKIKSFGNIQTNPDIILKFVEEIENAIEAVVKYAHIDSILDIGDKSVHNITNLINDLTSNINNSRENIYKYNQELRLAEKYEEDFAILNNRPSDCKNDLCPFIKKAVESKAKYIALKPEELVELRNQEEVNIINGKQLLESYMEFKSIIETIQYYHSRITTFSIDIDNFYNKYLSSILDYDVFCSLAFTRRNYDNILDSCKLARDYANTVKLYEMEYEAYSKMNERMVSYNRVANRITYLSHKQTDLHLDIESINDNIESYKSGINKMAFQIKDEQEYVVRLDSRVKLIDEYIVLSNQYNSVVEELAMYSVNNEDIKAINAAIKENEKIRITADSTLNELREERSKVAYSLTILEDYTKELELYDSTYKKIENIKYYTSPTTGIQTVFMETYMNTIIAMANNLLELMFNSEYRLLPFIINESEFRIPCAGKGYINDDISSMSTSQICMISMILSFSILHHASNTYNILKLDEIDGGLDTLNRLQFIRLLEELMKILSCEQCIMISHNTELATSDIDLIVLTKGYDTSDCNVIFQA